MNFSGRAQVSGSKIFNIVFNEKYIDKNVKIDSDGLGTIILLGGQVDLQADIDHYTALLETAQREHDAAKLALEAFGNKHNPLSPNYHLERIKKELVFSLYYDCQTADEVYLIATTLYKEPDKVKTKKLGK